VCLKKNGNIKNLSKVLNLPSEALKTGLPRYQPEFGDSLKKTIFLVKMNLMLKKKHEERTNTKQGLKPKNPERRRNETL
jgi:hypothetical protein